MPQANAGRKPAPPAAQPYTPGSIASMSRDEYLLKRADLLNGLKVPL